jgi:hypothetical protein
MGFERLGLVLRVKIALIYAVCSKHDALETVSSFRCGEKGVDGENRVLS